MKLGAPPQGQLNCSLVLELGSHSHHCSASLATVGVTGIGGSLGSTVEAHLPLCDLTFTVVGFMCGSRDLGVH